MSEKGTPNGKGKGWTDAERLVYLVAFVENSGVKFDYKNTPRPEGRTIIACQRMVDRLKVTYKDELAVLNGQIPDGQATPKKKGATTGASTPRKRKPKGDAALAGEADDEGSPKKKGRKKAQAQAEEEMGTEIGDDVKYEFKEEPMEDGFEF